MKIGDADIDEISYAFYKERFYAVQIRFHGYMNFTALKSTLFEQYGHGKQPNRFMQEYWWDGGTVSTILKYFEIEKKGVIAYRFAPIAREIEADRKEKAKKGSKDL